MSEALGPDERMERDRRQRRAVILCVLMAAGAASGLALAVAEPKGAQIRGMAVGGTTIVLLYPVWYPLRRGRLAPEPGANVVFVALYVVMACAYLWKKFR